MTDKKLSIKELCSKKRSAAADQWILIVDDSITMQHLMGRVLKEGGYKSKTASNGQIALDLLLSKKTPDLILMDIEMPVMNGYQALEEVRKRKEFDNVPVIMVTALDKDVVSRVLKMGANDYVVKPFDNEELLARISAHLRVERLNKEQELLYRQAELYYQSYKNSNDAIIITDTNGEIAEVNRAFTKLFVCPSREIVGKKVNTLSTLSASPETYKKIFKKIWKEISDSEVGAWSGELTNLVRQKENISVILSITPIKDKEIVIGFMWLFLNITVRKKLEEALRNYNTDLEKMVKERVREIEETQDATIIGLAKLAEYRDPETGEHLQRIRNYTRILAEDLANLKKYKGIIDDRYLDMIYKSSPLHDIGKVGIPDSILLKPGKLTNEEFEIMKKHAVFGGDAIEATEKTLKESNRSYLTMGKEIAYYHHEKWNGNGYPYGLKGEDIPLSARIMALADVYDALTSKRVYKGAFSHEEARSIILKDKGTHFDPEVVDAFLHVEKEFSKVKKSV